MKRLLVHCLAMAIILGNICTMSSARAENHGQADWKDAHALFEKRTDAGLPYRLLIPENYDPRQAYPLVVFFHGAGQRGADNEAQLCFTPELFLRPENRRQYPCFVLAVQCPADRQWVDTPWSAPAHTQPAQPTEALAQVLRIMTRLDSEYNFDHQRLYALGLSMGGYAVWDVITRDPHLFAAAVPICGGADLAQAGRIASLPLWVFHGALDEVVPPCRSRDMVAALRAAGGSPRYTEYPTIGHGAWGPAAAEPELLPWLFAQRNPLPQRAWASPPVSAGAMGSCAEGIELHVAPGGNPAACGTLAQPLPTLEAARDLLRQRKAPGQNRTAPVTVWVHGGNYYRTQPFSLTAEDSGTSASPVIYRAWPNDTPRLIGGLALDPKWFAPVTAQTPGWSVLPRLARGKIVVADLKLRGIRNYGALMPRGFNKPGVAALELFINGRPMTLARWPNRDYAYTVDAPAGTTASLFRYRGNRPARWTKAAEPWVMGMFFHEWADDACRITHIDPKKHTLRIDPPPFYGIKEDRSWYAFNLLEELDQPGEWYLDRKRGLLYLYPPRPLAQCEMIVSVLDRPLIQTKDASHLILRGLTIEACRANAVEVGGGEHVRLEQCTIRNAGVNTLVVTGGRRHGIERSEICGSGAGGVVLTGGDRATLEPAGHYARNCRIHDYSRVCKVYFPGVLMRGVGCVAAHNEIHDAPHYAIQYFGNEHLVEYNHIYRVCQSTDDAGAIYTGRDWGAHGNVIRYNYIHDIDTLLPGRKFIFGIYLDDCVSGNTVYGNVIDRVRHVGILLGGGRDTTVRNNIISRCGAFGIHLDSRGTYMINEIPGNSCNLLEGIQRYHYDRPPWSLRYPKLAATLKEGYGEAKKPKGNLVAHNIGWKNKTWLGFDPASAEQYLAVDGNLADRDPRFVDRSRLNLGLRADSPLQALDGFAGIPFSRMGVEPVKE